MQPLTSSAARASFSPSRRASPPASLGPSVSASRGYERNPWTKDNRLGILGYAVTREEQGNGYAREAAASVVQLAFNEMGLERLRATVLRDNAASRRVLERPGFTIKDTGVHETPRYGGSPRLGGHVHARTLRPARRR